MTDSPSLRKSPFLWGASTAAHQVEGGNRNQWTEWEEQKAGWLADTALDRMRQQMGFGFSHERLKPFVSQMSQAKNYRSGRAVDHYHRFREDFQLAKELGHTAHRFSIEWSRVEPAPGQFDDSEIAHYAEVIAELRRLGIEPVVTLFHWTLPLWLADEGGFLSPHSPKYFTRFVEKIAQEFAGSVRYWVTVNEPTVYASASYLQGFFPPQQKKFWSTLRVVANLVRAHRAAYRVIKSHRPDAMVGYAHHHTVFEAADHNPITRVWVAALNFVWNECVLRCCLGRLDFIGLNHYFRLRFKTWRQVKPTEEVSDLGWPLVPDSLRRAALDLKKFGKPIIVTEHGCADADDSRRATFITESLAALEGARNEGSDIRGYLHWSLLDNFEWDKGFWPRFGLIEIQYDTLDRRVRPSAKVYANCIAESKAHLLN